MAHVTWLRALAALLIVNSHLEAQHPIPQAAVDGLLGNSLFFFLAGLGLALGEVRGTRRGFPEWYARRLSRIVPSVALAIFALDYLPNRGWVRWSATEHLRNFVAPPGFTFVEQILVLYVPFFLVQRIGGRRGNALALSLTMAAMALVPAFWGRSVAFHPFHWLYYFAMMLFGAWVARRDEPARPVSPRIYAALALAALAYGAAKLAGSRPRFAEWYPLLHFVVFPLIYLLARSSQSEAIARFIGRRPRLGRTLGLVGGLTLEIYLVHYAVRDSAIVARLPFPMNILAIFLGSVALAYPLARGADGLRGAFRPVSEGIKERRPAPAIQGTSASPSESPS